MATLRKAERELAERETQLSALQELLRARDERVATLERLCAENRNSLIAINENVDLQGLNSQSGRLAAMGLVLASLDEPSKFHRISKVTTTIGRDAGNDFTINSNSVSRYHARIVVVSDSTYLINLESANGCSVNGQRISRQILAGGDVIVIGDVKFRFDTGVAQSESEVRSMDETTFLDDSVLFSLAPTAKADSVREQVTQDKSKDK
jgi:pSer/pThr/pTyr-binding forkhead associated (FHA) protein